MTALLTAPQFKVAEFDGSRRRNTAEASKAQRAFVVAAPPATGLTLQSMPLRALERPMTLDAVESHGHIAIDHANPDHARVVLVDWMLVRMY